MNKYQVWWKESTTGSVLNKIVGAFSKEDAKSKIREEFGYKAWDIKFTKVEIVSCR